MYVLSGDDAGRAARLRAAAGPGRLTHREISLVMQISEPAAHRNVFESLKQLRKGTQR
jgi:hypothetical protein